MNYAKVLTVVSMCLVLFTSVTIISTQTSMLAMYVEIDHAIVNTDLQNA